MILALLLQPWIPALDGLFFPLFASALAAPASTLRLRNRRVVWMGLRYAGACCASVLGASLPVVLVGASLGSLDASILRVPNVAESPLVVVFVVLTGLFSGWLANVLQRWAARAPSRPRPVGPGEYLALGVPREVVGGTLAFIGSAGLTWFAILWPRLPVHGPDMLKWLLVGAGMGGIGLAGLVVVLEVHVRRTIHQRSARAP